MGEAMERTLVIGCGGVGGVVAARLRRAGRDVTAVTGNQAIADAIAANGLSARLDDGVDEVALPAHAALTGDLVQEPFDLCILTVPPDAAEDAVRENLPYLRDGAPIVCMPNGLIEDRVSRIVEPERVIGGVVEFGARMLGPGRIAQTAPGGVTVGRLPKACAPSPDAVLEAVSALLADVGPVHPAENLEGARWSKLAINCAISSLGTIGGDRLGVLMRRQFVRRLALEVMTEVVEVGGACGVRFEKVSGTIDLPWMALDAEERLRSASVGLVAKHTVLLAVGTKYREMRSSMLAAIERGRRPSVDFLNGEVVERGEATGVPTPVNEAVRRTVHAIAAGDQASGLETLRRVYEQTREPLRELELAN